LLRQFKKNSPELKLNIGCGFCKMAGWSNSDIKYGNVFIDLTSIHPEMVDFGSGQS